MTTEPIDLDAVQALADAATEGPWTTRTARNVWGELDIRIANVEIGGYGGYELHQADAPDAEFIAQARTLVPALIAELLEARAEVARVSGVVRELDAALDYYSQPLEGGKS